MLKKHIKQKIFKPQESALPLPLQKYNGLSLKGNLCFHKNNVS